MSNLKAHLENIKLSHSIFALPFAYMGACLAVMGIPSLHDLAWITIAMVGARSAALALDNLIDLKYDRLDPRLNKRPLVRGAVKPSEVIAFIVISFAVFFLATLQLHPLCITLWPLAVLPLVIYPYMKRFTWLCHLILGSALACAPLGAWIAIRGEVNLAVILLGMTVAIWIAAFDIVYACLDEEFDRSQGLHSVPVRFGARAAMRMARIMHMVSIATFVYVGVLLAVNPVYYFGVLLAATVLIYQHSIVSAGDFSQITQKYFLRNGLVSILVFCFTVMSLIIK